MQKKKQRVITYSRDVLCEHLFSDKIITANVLFMLCFWYLTVVELELEGGHPQFCNHISLGNLFESFKWKISSDQRRKAIDKIVWYNLLFVMILSQHYPQILHASECRILHCFASIAKKKKRCLSQNTLELFCSFKYFLKQASESTQFPKEHHTLP